jgi:glyoxylate/hydroxypyruvate reductase A
MAWTAQQNHPRHRCFQGQAGLKKVCENSLYLVVLLPLNEQTQGIINQQTLSWCHTKTTLINVGRGGHVNEVDLLQALNLGLIKQAVLDVFNAEPLPINHPFWNHPKITLTPHSSSRSDVKQTAKEIVRMYQQL